jgi:hypothetical protein
MLTAMTQIVQDMHAGEDCFLAQPQWRKALSLHYDPKPPPSHKLEAIELRNALCDLLVDVPGMVQETQELLASPAAHEEADHLTRLERTLRRVLRMKDGVNSWYGVFAEAAPYDAAPGPILMDGAAEIGVRCSAGLDRPNLLYTVLDCVANSVLARLDGMLLVLSSLLRGSLGDECLAGTFALSGVEARRQTARAAFELVKSKSPVAAKPLEFGLRQIWSNAGMCDMVDVQSCTR